jgi:hypothetical protein
MPATVRGTAGLVFGCVAETGGLIQNFKIDDAVDEIPAENHEGEEVGSTTLNRKQRVTGKWIYLGTSGIGAMTPGVTTTLAGIPGTLPGLRIVIRVTDDRDKRAYESRDFELLIRPLIV